MAFSLYADRTAGRIVGRSNSFVTVEGEGSGVTEDGRIWLDPDATEPVTVRARSGWLVNGQESVTVTPSEIRTLRSLGAAAPSFDYESKTGEDSDDHHSCVAPGPTETNRHERTFSISASSTNQLVVYVFPETSVVVTASASYKIEKDGLHVKEKKWEAWSCDQCENSQSEKKEESPYAVEPDTYSWTAEGADLKFNASEWKGPLPKGLGQDVRFSVTGKCESCSSCECGASAKAVIDVHELHIERPDYLGLDMTDVMKGVPVKRTATAVIDPNPYKATYGWSGGGVCKYLEDEDGNPVVHDQAVTYYATNGMGPSASCGAEMLTVDVSVKNKNREGLTASATCTTNFTVVKVDVEIKGVGESEEETAPSEVYFSLDEDDGGLTKFARENLSPVKITCQPEDLPSSLDLTLPKYGQLFEIGEGGVLSAAKSAYPVSEVLNKNFGLHGHSMPGQAGEGIWDNIKDKVVSLFCNDELAVCHEESKAVDKASFNVVPPPPLEVVVDFISPSGKWPYDPVWDDPKYDTIVTVDGSKAKECAENDDNAKVVYSLSRDARSVEIKWVWIRNTNGLQYSDVSSKWKWEPKPEAGYGLLQPEIKLMPMKY